MTLDRIRSSWPARTPFHTAILMPVVAALTYLVARLGGALVVRPQMLWPLWPGCAFLVAVLLLMPRRIWPVLIAAGMTGFVLYDLQEGLTLRTTALLVLADTVEVLIAALGVSYAFDGVPTLDSLRSLAKYSFFAVVLAPVAAAFISSTVFGANYWIRLRIGFFTEALALLTLTPAIFRWVGTRRAWRQRPRAFYFEAAGLIAGLSFLGYVAFFAPGRSSSPALLYSLLPFLLWSALRFGVPGISASMLVVAFISIWGAVHGRGPFIGSDPLSNVMSLQLFLFFAAATFTVLAVVVEAQKQTERAFRESEKRFRLVADTAPALIWMAGTDRLCNYFNKPWLDFTGRSLDSECGSGWADGVHPEDLRRCMDTYTRAFDRREEFRMEYRLRRHDGEYRWVLDIGVPRFSLDRSFIGYIGCGVDVSERKHAEEALSTMNRRLIDAQEQERARIARELHDDIGQRVSLLAVELDQLHQDPDSNVPDVRSRLGELQKQASEIATGIQTLSHELHSSKLEYLGLAGAMKGFCQEFGRQQKMQIDFNSRNLPDRLSPELSLCLLRVLQEALHNSAKYSGVRHVEVGLWEAMEEIHLTVSDSGAGFDPATVKESRGLGLVSMEERLKLLNGILSIDSQRNHGTTVHARVPFNSGSDSLRAAG